MVQIETLTSLKIGPDPARVFSEPDRWSPYMLPLVSFDLSEVFDDLSGTLHFIDPIEPYGGFLGAASKSHHTYYCRENWISFKRDNGLYIFEMTEAYFSKVHFQTHPAPSSLPETARAKWTENIDAHYIRRTHEYAAWQNKPIKDRKETLVLRLGGSPQDANWAHVSDFPLYVDSVETTDRPFPDTYHYPLTEDGRRFRYIGSVEAFDWRCVIHLFFDPIEQRALQTFDWT